MTALIEIYTTTTCPYCDRAKELFARKGLSYHEIDVSENAPLRAQMQERAHGLRTVPQIFIRGQHVGGYTDLYALDQAGDLDRMFADV